MIIHAKIQKWGNGLALRIGGAMREIPHFQAGTAVDIKVTPQGFTVKKSVTKNKVLFPYSEAQLLKDLSPHTAHTDLLATPLPHEIERA